ncbi:MAG TPA: hypothetical protein VFC65_06665 [Prolixibacteraceae bacterium]|nr:hypothetical protein [Prolixibacteraceae bacterium]
MNTKILLFTFIFLCVLFTEKATSAPIKIFGKAPEYALNSIDLNILHDFISEEKIKLGTIRFNAEGVFSLELELTETSLCFADFDGYHGMIYLEPGKSYEIVLPPKQELSESQKRNPFAKPEPIWFGLLNPVKNELNVQIQQFEHDFAILENKYFDRIYTYQSKSLVDTVKMKIDKEFPKTTSTFFESHKLFRKANIEFALHQGKASGFMESYFSTIKPIYNLAAYSTLFNQVFLNYFNVLTNEANSTEIKEMIYASELRQLDDYFQKQLHFNRELSHFVLLKSMNDAYYNNQFPKASILRMLDRVKTSGWSAYEQKTAQLIRSKLTYLTSGTKPPEIKLKDLNGQRVSFSDYQNSYIYLHFTDPKNPICRQHLDILKGIAAHYKDKFIIINVIPGNTAFKNDSGWPGIFTTTESNTKETYKVKTYPNSFLIGKDGKLLLSPAPNPIDGLDRQLGQLFKSDYFKELQKNNSQKN